jgi:hypothetical protein
MKSARSVGDDAVHAGVRDDWNVTLKAGVVVGALRQANDSSHAATLTNVSNYV